MEDTRKLTKDQERFVTRYLIHRNATLAAKEAGYSEKTAEQIGYQLLQKTSVKNAIDEKLNKILKDNELTADWVIKRLMAIADTHLEEVIDLEGDNFRLRSSKEVDRLKLLAVDSFEDSFTDMGKFSRRNKKLKFVDKNKSLRMLGERLGIFGREQDDGTRPTSAEEARERGTEEIQRDFSHIFKDES